MIGVPQLAVALGVVDGEVGVDLGHELEEDEVAVDLVALVEVVGEVGEQGLEPGLPRALRALLKEQGDRALGLL